MQFLSYKTRKCSHKFTSELWNFKYTSEMHTWIESKRYFTDGIYSDSDWLLFFNSSVFTRYQQYFHIEVHCNWNIEINGKFLSVKTIRYEVIEAEARIYLCSFQTVIRILEIARCSISYGNPKGLYILLYEAFIQKI